MRKLTDQQKIDIVKKYEDGESSVKISKEYNVSRQAIIKILKVRNVSIRNEK